MPVFNPTRELYAGVDYTNLNPTPSDAGIFTIEADRLWFYDGAAWGQTPYSTGTKVTIGLEAYNNAATGNGVAIGWSANSTGVNAIALGNSCGASGADAVSLGSETVSNGQGSISVGALSATSFDQSVALGFNSQVSGLAAIAVGGNTIASGGSALALGDSVTASGSQSIAIGTGSTASGSSSVSIGYNGTVSGTRSIGISLDIDNPLSIAGTDCFVFGRANPTPVDVSSSFIFGESITSVTGSGYNAAFGTNHTLEAEAIGNLVAGVRNKVSARDCVATGTMSRAHITGSVVHSSGYLLWGEDMDSQSLHLQLKGLSSNTTPQILISGFPGVPPSAINQLSPLPGGVITFQGIVDASALNDTGVGASWTVSGRVHRGGSPTETVLSFSTVTPLWNPSSHSLTITADDTIKCARFTFTASGAGTYKIVASLNCIEVR